MGDATVVYIRPVWVGGSVGYRYDIEYEGAVVVEGARVPLCDAARWCAGVGKNGKVEVWRYGGSGPAMIAEIERYATLTVSEGERDAPRFRRWVPFEQRMRDDATL